jgi:Acetyltransferase (GNAT) domain
MVGFWVALDEQGPAGDFGLEPAEIGRELRRMYVDARCRRKGLGRLMLAHAERVAGRQGSARIGLSPPSVSRPRSCSTMPPAISWSGKRSPPPSPTEPSEVARGASTSRSHSPVPQTGLEVNSTHMQPSVTEI